MFIQLPIFVGLYRSLMVDVELRQAALFPGLDWCSNLAAPDMLFRWDSWMPSFFADETGWLGPYFNLLPIFTIALFIWQQKMFMPPPADEQAAMQQKMMKYMMVVMGFMFFKVASGLCIYFIASSLWGIAERKLLPKTTGGNKSPEKKSEPEPRKAIVSTSSGNGQSGRSRKRQRGGK
jgi:YidC/Oxa1 family membrane protein insertase